MVKKKNVMDSLLCTDDKAFEGSTKELDCLIYRGSEDESKSDLPEPILNPSWTEFRGNVSVEIWEGKAKIRIKVSGDDNAHVSMRKLASIAVEAIMAELQKEKDQ
ncbi:MAG TPA: hypothetical protein DCR95_11855 [Desulfobacter sp.]|jgi:hypothetical protein|uniref:hypothetical protein n=1 Tax=unclassified Desulfobacter TaxID=2634406 RepID=UPI000E7D9A8C|nr:MULTISPECIES: hypothetical protein [unclassified Desulfobacter]HRF90587.1 hypothetical protein [Desulfobacter postgatei]MBP8828926.1 hypothetical protein [Desulfobacter sp.]MBP9597852.1 hypothetical protein [Desulfobacter sp.]HAR34744.1 hypothetical protein [Desulfobacter sp.]HBT87586.1 hypothetical protein [Desulfobacter sp.]